MQYFIDSADVDFIRKMIEFYPIEGITTNPTIISKEKKDFKSLVLELRSLIPETSSLHVQCVSAKSEDIIREAHFLRELLGPSFYAKIPVTPEGIKAISALKRQNFHITATAIFTTQQALIAAIAGADYAAPYVDRLDNISADGVKVVADMIGMFTIHSLPTKVLAASFKNVEQVNRVCLAGAHSVTVGKDLFPKLLAHPLTTSSVDQFTADWEKQYGKGKTILTV